MVTIWFRFSICNSFINIVRISQSKFCLNGCWWRILETKCAGDNFRMLMTVMAILVIDIHNLFSFAPGINIYKSSPTLSHQHRDVTNITKIFRGFKKLSDEPYPEAFICSFICFWLSFMLFSWNQPKRPRLASIILFWFIQTESC